MQAVQNKLVDIERPIVPLEVEESTCESTISHAQKLCLVMWVDIVVCFQVPSPETKSNKLWKLIVGRWCRSFWDSLFSPAMLVSQDVSHHLQTFLFQRETSSKGLLWILAFRSTFYFARNIRRWLLNVMITMQYCPFAIYVTYVMFVDVFPK